MNRRTFIKASSMASGIGVIGSTVSMPGVAQKSDKNPPEDDDSRGKKEIPTASAEFEVIDETVIKKGSYRGDDVYGLHVTLKINREPIPSFTPLDKPNDFLTFYWDGNIFGLKSMDYANVIYRMEDVIEHPTNGEYERIGSDSITYTEEDDKSFPGGNNGWSAEYPGCPWVPYENEHGLPDCYAGPESITYKAGISLIHQDDSSGRIGWELGHILSGDDVMLDNISLCAAGTVCYNFGSDEDKDTYDSGIGMLVP